MAGDGEAEALARGRLDIHLLSLSAAVGGDVRRHLSSVGRQSRSFSDNHCIDVAKHITCCGCALPHLAQQRPAVRVLVCHVGFGKVPPDVALPDRPENRIADSVQKHVGVGMTFEAALKRKHNSTEHQSPAFDQAMNVKAAADATPCHRARLALRPARIASASAMSSG